MAEQAGSFGRMMYLHALSPIHTGTGESVDTIDLPITRERITNWPYIPGSSIKGVLRAASRGVVDAEHLSLTFGPETTNADDHAGGVWFSDARLLCLPVRSLAGSFAWVTCPMVLHRWSRDHRTSGLPDPLAATPPVPAQGEIHLTNTAATTVGIGRGDDARVYLEDLDLIAVSSQAASICSEHIASAAFPLDTEWQRVFRDRFGIVHDDVFGFLADTATELVARIRLKENEKTVADGGLWYEEALPAESILTCPVVVSRQGAALAETRPTIADGATTLLGVVEQGTRQPLQIGGSASVGRGMVQVRLSSGGQA